MMRCRLGSVAILIVATCLAACSSTPQVCEACSGVLTVSSTRSDGGSNGHPSGNGGYTLDLGTVAVGYQATAVIILTNTGPAPLQILTVGDPTDSEFSLSMGLTGELVLQSGGETGALVTFAPVSTGQKTGTLSLTTDSNIAYTFVLTFVGTGTN